MSDFITGRVAFGPSHESPQDIIRLHELQIRRLKQERDEAQERCGRLLAALDEALDTIRAVQARAGLSAGQPHEKRPGVAAPDPK